MANNKCPKCKIHRLRNTTVAGVTARKCIGCGYIKRPKIVPTPRPPASLYADENTLKTLPPEAGGPQCAEPVSTLEKAKALPKQGFLASLKAKLKK
jgi:Zn ribbon nucleic-acid-binding protein